MVEARFFFQPVHLGRQPPDLGVQLLQLLGAGGALRFRPAAAALEHAGQPLERGRFPLTEQIRVHPVLGSDLTQRLDFPKHLLDDLGLERRAMLLSHAAQPNLFPRPRLSNFLGPLYSVSAPLLAIPPPTALLS